MCIYIYIYIYICSVVPYTCLFKPEVDLLCMTVFTGNVFICATFFLFLMLNFYLFLTDISTKDITRREKAAGA